MAKDTLTRSQIHDSLSDELGLSREQSSEILEFLLHAITQGLIKDCKVGIRSFDTFYVQNKAQRLGRNPKTGVEVVIPSCKRLTFRPSSILKEKIRKITAANQQ